MPDATIQSWLEDPEFQSLDVGRKQSILTNYFNSNLTDDEFYSLPDPQKVSIRDNFIQQNMPQPEPAAPESKPERSAAGYALGLAKLAGRGALEGLSTELPRMVGKGMEFVGIDAGKDLAEWSEKKAEDWFGEEPKDLDIVERSFYEGAKMLAPSIVPAGTLGTGARLALGVGKLVKGAKVAQIAGDGLKSAYLMNKASKAAKAATAIAGGGTAAIFGLSQSQETLDTANAQADALEQAGNYQEAAQVREGAMKAAFLTGGIEAAGEYLGTKYLGKLFRLDEAEVVKRGTTRLITDFFKTLGVEVSTEMGQAGGQAATEKYFAVRPEAAPMAEALNVIGPTMFMTLVSGGAGAVSNSLAGGKQPINVLDPKAEEILEQIKGIYAKPGVPLETPWPAEMQQQAEEEYWRRQVEEIQRQRAQMQNQYGGIALEEAEPEGPVIEPAVSGQGAAMRTANQLVMDEAENVPEIPMKTEEEYLKGKNLFGTLEDNQPASSPYSPEMAQRKKTALSTPLLPVGTQNFEMVENKGGRIPPSLQGAFQIMETEVANGQVERGTLGGTTEHIIGSPYPDWFRMVSDKNDKGQGWSRKEFDRILELAKSGGKMTSKQEAKFQQLLKVAEEYQNTHPDLVDTDESEAAKYEPMAYDVFVLRHAGRKNLADVTPEEADAADTAYDDYVLALRKQAEPVLSEEHIKWLKPASANTPEMEAANAREEAMPGLDAVGQEQPSGEGTLPDREGVPLPEETDRESQALGELEEKISRQDQESIADVPSAQTVTAPVKAEASKDTPQQAPGGWTESTPGGMITSNDPETGGIIDSEIKSGKWFAVPNKEGFDTIDGFDTREDAYAALQKAVKAKPPTNKKEIPGSIAKAANEAATSPENDLPEPTEAQIEAGNYQKGHLSINGLDISIESPDGSTRKGTDEDGKKWESTMVGHYGYVKGTEGRDGDQVDVFLAKDYKEDAPVFVVDQVNPKTGEFDEHKILMGYGNQLTARKGYHDNYEKGWKGLGAITTISMPEFKEWLKNGDQSVPVGKVSTTVEKPSTPVETKPLTKKEKSLQEYRDYVASLTDEQRKAAGELIVESPEAPSGQTLKIKKVLADVEKGIKAPKTDTVELVTRSLATGKEETITVKKNPAPEKPEQQKTIIPSGFSKLPGSGNYKSDFGEYLISGKPGEYRLSDESTGRVIGGTYTDLETAGKKAAQDHIERNRTPDAGRNTQEAEKQPKLTISYGSTKIAEKPGPAMPEYGSSNKLFTKDAADAARELLKARLNRLNTGLDPELVQAGIQLAGYHVEAGARSFAAYSKAMIADIGEAVRPYLRAWYEAIRYYPGFKNEGMTTPADIDAGNLTKEEKVDIINQKTEKSKPKKKEREYVDDIFRSGEATPEGQQTALFSADAGERGVGRVLPEGSGVRLRPEAADDRSGSIRGRSGRKSTGDAVQLDPTEDYRITDQDDLGKGGPKQKFNDNIAAIRILSELEGREPTAEDRKILVKYVGWGGLPQAFYRPDGSVSTGWESEAKELKNLLPKDQYEAARASTQDAHYTNKTIIDAIYSGLNRLGFTGGKVLEPSVGTGNFIGLMPGDIRKRSKVTGIELDGTTSAIAKTLYPKQNIVNSGFQEVDITEGSFDLAIGNPPFGSKKLFDPNHKDLKTFSIHNYFFAKSIKALRENGLLAMVVSNAMMDKINSQQRDWMAERAELLGAIRLPNDAFRETAGTDVTTDIIFLRKLADGEKNNGQAWSEVKNVQGPDGITYRINEYFANNPGMMLGELAPNKLQPTEIEDGFYNAIPGLVARKGEKWKEELLNNDALMVLPENVYKKGQTIEDVQKPDIIVSDPGFIKPFGYGLDDKGRAVRRLPDKNGEPVYEAVTYSDKPLEGNRLERFKGLMEIRDALRRLIREEAADISEVRMKMYRRALNETYDRFIQKFGYVSNDANGQALKDDSIDLPLIRALESNYDKGVSAAVSKSTGEKQRKPSAKKAAIFKERVRFPYKSPEKAKNAKDALAIVLREDGFVNMPRIKQFLGKPEDILSELDGLVFVDPVTGAYETADIYLSGNVKKKLSQAKAAGPRYETNAKALEKVIPEDVPPEMIAVRVGATWVPIDVYETFAGEVLKTDVDIAYSDVTGVWSVQPRRGQASEYDSPRMFAGDIFKAMLQSKDIAVYDRNDDGSRTLNKDQTTIAKAKAEEIDRAFSDWWLNDMNRRETMAQIFNDKVNTTVEGRFDGAHMIFPGMGIITPGTPRDDQLRKNQKDVVWRNILKGKGLADHVVGSGKTFAAIATGMEMKRMGLLSKPMYVVPNHLVQQWAKDFQNLYPGANVLAIGRNDFSKKNRREFLGRIATGNWDAVLLAHSSFGFIKAPFEYERTFYAEQLADYEQAIQELKAAEGGKARSVKELEKARDRLKEKLKALGDKPKDDVVDFSELGVDGLFVDEAHEFKNLFYVTKRTRVAGLGNPEGSKKAFDMFVKTRYLLETNNDKGVFFLTGTPVSNSIAEMYTMMRYLDYDRLKEMGIRHFDQWSNMFASAVSDWEVDPSGTRYRLQSKMDFVNILGLISFYKDFADVVTNNDLRDWAKESGGVWPIPDVKGGKPELVVVERSDLQKSFMAWIVHRFDNMPSDPRLDNPLKATGEAMKASLDIRMIDPSLPDHPGSKVNVAVDNLKKIYDEFNDVKGTQLVFCDLSVPKKASSKLRDEISKLRSDIEKAEALIGFEEDAEDNYLELVAELEKYSPAELMAADSGDFSVYDDIKQKLIARGIPANEIAFIHDANTDNQKTDLFSKVRSGSVRILIGSTSKMGAGMNVQNKLVALHHLDAPWRPSDLEQREGRIVRQGNEFFDDLIKRTGERFQVRILRYSTNQTLDTRRWQAIERKARNIEQLRVGGHKWGDKIEDATEAATNAAEMKAASSGNPLILEEIRIRQDIENLESLKRGWRSQRFTHERTVSTAETFERNYPDWLDDIAADRKLLEDNPKKEKTEWEVSFDGRTFKPTGIVEAEDGDKKAEEKNALAYKLAITDLANSLRDWMSSKASGTTVLKYRGIEFDVENGEKLVYIEPDLKTQGITGNYRITLDVGDKISPEGFALRLDNVLDKALSGLDGMLSYLGSERKRHQQNAENARRALDKKFEEDEKIEALRKKHQEVLTQLQKTESAGAGQEEQDFSMWTGGGVVGEDGLTYGVEGLKITQDQINETLQSKKDSILRDTDNFAQGVRTIPAGKGKYPLAEKLGARTVSQRIRDDINNPDGIVLKGQKVESPEDLAVLAQVFRDPRYETFRIFYTKGNKIVDHEGWTSKLPSQTVAIKNMDILTDTGAYDDPIGMAKKAYFQVKTRMKIVGADGYYLLHNHPSGVPNPSTDDIASTKKYNLNVPGFKGHIIIDSGTYCSITPEVLGGGLIDAFDIPGAENGFADPLVLEPDNIHGRRIMSDVDIVKIAQELKNKTGYATLFYASAKGRVNGVQEIPLKALRDTPIDEIHDFLLEQSRRFGAPQAMAHVFKEGRDSNLDIRLKKLIEDGSLIEAIYQHPDTAGDWSSFFAFGVKKTGDKLFGKTMFKTEMVKEKEFSFNKNSTDNIGRYQVAPPRSENPNYFKKDAFPHADGAKSDFITKESNTEGITYTVGINAETGKQEVQAINFYRDRFTEAEAREWYNKNRKKFEPGKPPYTGGPGWKKMIVDGDGGEIYYRIRESNDLSKRAKIFQPPQWIAKKFPEFKAMFDLQETRVKRRLKKLANALDQTKNLWKMKNEDYETLRSLVWSMEAHGKIKAITADKFKENEDGEYVLNDEHYEQYSEVLDKIKGLNDAVKDEYLAVRKSLDQDLATVINQMRGMEDIDESVINEFRRSVGEIHNYFPHMRYGSHYVQVIDQNGEVVYREHFNTNGAGKLKIKARIKELAKEYPNHTFDAGKIEKLPEDVFSIPIPIEALEAVMDAAIQRMPDEESRLAFREALPRAVADALQTRGWGSHLINRKNIAGYEREDIKRVLFDYKSGLYGWLTKMEAARDFSNAMQEVAPQAKKKPVLWTYMRNYSRDMLANSDAVDRATNTARAIFFAKYLGGNFKTAALNLTQNIIAGWPRLGMETGNAMGAIIHGAASDLVDIATKKKHLEGDEKRLLQEMLEEGTTQSNFLNEVRGQVSANVFSVWNKTMKVLGWPMAAAEGFNRSSLALAAFRAASSGKIINKQTLERYGMEPGIKWEYEKAKEFAEEIVADSHFVYGNENRPEMFRGGMANKWAALGYTFRTFTHNLINLWSYMLKSGGPGRRAALKSLAATMAIGGMASVPLYKTFINIMQQLTGDDPEEKLLEMIGAEDTDQLRDMIVYGFPSALGVNLGGSLGMELPGMDRVKINDSFAEIGKDLLWDIIGIPTATLEDATNAIEAMSTGQYSRALEYVLPTAAANPIKAVRMYNEGQTTLSGATVGAAGQGGTAQPNQYTEGEMIRKMLGFQPIRASKEWDLYKEAQNFIVKRQRFQSDLATKYAIAYRKDDKRAKAEVLADWKAWNEEQRELGRDWLIIGQDNLKSSITARIRGRKSPKYMRKREADMVDRMGLD